MSDSRKQRIVDWVKESIPVDTEELKTLTNEPVPNHLKHWWFALGGTPAILFVIQVVTGIFLLFHYVPTPEEAYASVQRISDEARFGWYIRSIHKWASELMIVTVMLHMARVFFTGAYRRPRELNWMIGVALLFVVLGLGFTGYSLIYDQLSYWAAMVGAQIAAKVPLAGPIAADFIRGGPEVTGKTLTRLYVFHIVILPATLAGLVAL
ncbi:MAG: cytochrome bc complex cytochrome b subunit, partial [Nitrospinales bacterium]